MPDTRFELRTDRLRLRQWRDDDRPHFATMNSDTRVMRYFPRVFTVAESDDFVTKNVKNIAEHGWGNWAVDVVSDNVFIGFVGLSEPADWHPCAGTVEIGWRLRYNYWGFGYATEAARSALRIGFTTLGLDEIVSFTSACNSPSIAVMKKLGMRKDREGFDHPRIDESNPLRQHVIYRLTRETWKMSSTR